MIFRKDFEFIEGSERDTYRIKTAEVAVDIIARSSEPHDIDNIIVQTDVESKEDVQKDLLEKSRHYQGNAGIYMAVLNLYKAVNKEPGKETTGENGGQLGIRKITKEQFYEWISRRHQERKSKENRKTGKDIFLERDTDSKTL